MVRQKNPQHALRAFAKLVAAVSSKIRFNRKVYLMQELITLVQLFQTTKFKINGLLNIILEQGSEMERLYDAIASGAVQSDEDARAIFPEYDKNPARLYSIKGKLKDRLNDSILLLDFRESSFTERQKAFFECSKKWAAAMTLISKNARENAINLLENLLRHTLRYEFTELTLDILRTLRLHYGVLEGDQKKFDQIEEQINRYEEIWIMERKTEGFYAELVTRFVRTKSLKDTVSGKARLYFEQVKPFLEQCDTFKVQFFGRLIEIVIYDSINDYANTARLCEDALTFFEKKDYTSSIVLQVFHYNLFACYLNLQEYKKCLQLADKNEGLFEVGTYNWFKLQELYFLTAMHSGDFSGAAATCLAVFSHPNLEQQTLPVIELWKIFEAYTYLLFRVNLIPANRQTGKFKVSKFLNEIQVFSKDKAGMNIPVLIIQFLFDLVEGKWSQIIDRVDNLAKYRSRYIDGRQTVRSHAFIRMLELIPKASFKLTEVEKRAESILQQLRAVPLEAANQNHEIEIIPYEVLWTLVLNILGKPLDKTIPPNISTSPTHSPKPQQSTGL